jgi:uncharacterized protein (DUF433 family)
MVYLNAMGDGEPIIRLNPNRTPAVRGTRLTVYSIMDLYFGGETPEVIAEFFRIPVGDAQAAIDYINDHMRELMPHYRRMIQRDRQGNPPHIEAILAKSHEKLMQKKRELEQKRAMEAGDARAAG